MNIYSLLRHRNCMCLDGLGLCGQPAWPVISSAWPRARGGWWDGRCHGRGRLGVWPDGEGPVQSLVLLSSALKRTRAPGAGYPCRWM